MNGNDVDTRLRTLFEEADRPVTLDELRERRSHWGLVFPGPFRWSGPALAAAVFVVVLVVIGAVALLRPPGDPALRVADVPSLHDDVEGPALGGFSGLPAYLPAGLEPVIADTSFSPLNEGMTIVYRDSVAAPGAELTISTTRPIYAGLAGAEPPDIETMERRLREALPDLTVVQTTVRGQVAFFVEGGVPDLHGWETAVLVVESSDLLSQVLGTGVGAEDVLAVARSLQPTPRDSVQEWAVRSIGWDLRVSDLVEDPAEFVEAVASLDGVDEVVISPIRRLGASPDRIVQRDDDPGLPTTTMAADPDATTTTTITLVEAQPIQVLVTLAPAVDPLQAASAIERIGRNSRITLSPAAEEEVTAAFFERALTDAVVIYDDPTVFQPPPGPEPHFDTTTLGTEIPLISASPDPPDIAGAKLRSDLQAVQMPFPGRGAGEDSPLRGPILHIGMLEDGTRLVLTFDRGADYVERTIRDGVSGAALGSLGAYGYGETGGGGRSGGPYYMQVRVPLDTSVVMLELDDGTRLWQRPVAGHALIPVERGVRDPRPRGVVTALDADGDVIGRWETDE